MKLISHAYTDIGRKRKNNQDAYLKDDELKLYVVADGMGGHRGGEVASRVAVDELQAYCRKNQAASPREILDRGINVACSEIYKKSLGNDELAGMGTTVASLLFRDDFVYVGQVGDSRAYLLSQDGIWQISEDHSLLNEELRAGRIDPKQISSYQFRNVITRSVGYEAHVAVDIYRRRIQKDDMYLLCTDGLSGLVEIQEIQSELKKYGPDQGLKNLIGLANARGGDDNITALVSHVWSLD